jgi:hypothetical protein
MSSIAQSIRPAAVAGTFYPASPEALRAEVEAHVSAAGREAAQSPAGRPKLLIVPHAGYVYSGATAGRGYATLSALRGVVRRVVLVGPAHRVAVRGIALPSVDAFWTPLGPVPVDARAAARVASLPNVATSDRAHAWEHSLEVQLPFLQAMLGEFQLLPLLVGDASARDVALALETVWNGDDTLIVVSSDLSHYLPYEVARQVDRHTVERILAGDAALGHDEACGATPINGAMLCAARHGLSPRLLDLRNSGDTAGSRDRVVGYCAIAFEAAGGAQGAGDAGR